MLYALILSIVQSIIITITTILAEVLKKIFLGIELNEMIVSFAYLQSIFTYFIFSILPYLLGFYVYGLWLAEFKKNVNFKMVAVLNFLCINSIFIMIKSSFFEQIYILIIVASFLLSIVIYIFSPLESYVNTIKENKYIHIN
jgi:hypothetical protein